MVMNSASIVSRL